MSVLVVGGTGFIGREVMRRLARRGEKTIGFDINPRRSALADLGEAVTIVAGDATKFDDLAAAVVDHKVDRIINLAYILGEGETMPHRAVQVDVVAMDNCFEITRLFGVKRCVFASSIAYHGPSQEPFGDRPVTEDDPGYPGGIYVDTKQFNERLAAGYNALYGTSIVALRPPFVMGPAKPRGVMDHVEIITRPALGLPVRSPSREDAPYIVGHVGDIAEMFVRLTLAEAPHHTVYHAGGHTTTLGELAALVRQQIPAADIEFNPAGRGGFLVHRVDNSRIVGEFEVAHRSLAQLVADIIEDTRRLT
ncbi:MAG TPA: NAD(P)-dependent oxidoreductase [Dehalococcoidia bacterium]|nr:NAD(P)-dependent oxidoreductase [Dehalococcoidia bacterium]